MTAWQPRLVLEEELTRVDERSRLEPDDVQLRFDRAATLARLGRPLEARAAYLELLAIAPTHFGALNNLGTLLFETGFQTAARSAYAEAIKHHPENPTGHINLANTLVKKGEVELARHHFEAALRLSPDHADAHQGLAVLLTESGDEEQARLHRIKAFKDRPLLTFPYRGKDRPINVLVLASAAGSAVPIKRHLDDAVFATSALFVDFHDPAVPLPPHDVIFNAVGDADLCRASLEAAAEVVKRSTGPVINRPDLVTPTRRVENARRLADVPGVRTPRMASLARTRLERPAAGGELAQEFGFPLLLRSPGFHTGRFFVRVDRPQNLAAAVSDIPGEELLVIEYLDARGPDDKIRKYRVMMIDGELYPLHAAISHDWKIHYFSAEMAQNPQNRAEDAAFLADMRTVLGPRAMTALAAIRDTLGLDYAGADFSLGPAGEVLLFEANATMVVNPPDADAKWDYRRPAVQRVLDAIHRLLAKHAPDA